MNKSKAEISRNFTKDMLEVERKKLRAVHDKILRGDLDVHWQAAGLARSAAQIAQWYEILLDNLLRAHSDE